MRKSKKKKKLKKKKRIEEEERRIKEEEESGKPDFGEGIQVEDLDGTYILKSKHGHILNPEDYEIGDCEGFTYEILSNKDGSLTIKFIPID